MIITVLFSIFTLFAGLLAAAHWFDMRRYRGQAKGYALAGLTGCAISMLNSAEKAEGNACIAALIFLVSVGILLARFIS